MLIPATIQPGEPYDDLEELYGRMLGQWATELNHVTAIVGGLNSQQKHAGQDGVRFTPVPREKQAAAVKFLNDTAFATPTFALLPEVLRRIEPQGALDRIRAAQLRVLNSLLSNARLARLVEQDAIDGATSYKPVDFLTDVRSGIWRETAAPAPKIDAVRRNLQRAYLELLADKLNGRQPATGDARALLRGELRSAQSAIASAIPRTTDRVTRLHLEDARDQIAKALDPKFAPPAPAPGGNPFGFDDTAPEQFGCWPDYAIRRPRD
jgi:hypothetical protein